MCNREEAQGADVLDGTDEFILSDAQFSLLNIEIYFPSLVSPGLRFSAPEEIVDCRLRFTAARKAFDQFILEHLLNGPRFLD
ncbi:hypothetical protein [Rhizobium rhizophilum]|uniref:hypothetical protein n=1 Tax=Rhizobium rhizophilum TaxID=1850373 RepID=UPI0014562D81|nr:hypothetical protein [Rhizobium rhizophilum]